MTVIKTFHIGEDVDFYRVWINGEVKYCTLDEVMYILSTKEQE